MAEKKEKTPKADKVEKTEVKAAKAPRQPYTSRLAKHYAEDTVPKLKREFGIENQMAVPKVEKVVLNIGLGEAISPTSTPNLFALDQRTAARSTCTGSSSSSSSRFNCR